MIESENHQKSLSNKIDFLSSSKEVLLKSEVSHKFDINQKKNLQYLSSNLKLHKEGAWFDYIV
nr:hypothetical protein [Orientia tsutsugamushi]